MFYWIMRHVVGGPLLRLYFRPWVKGLDKVPTSGPVILASNHLAVIDSFVLPLVLDRQVKFIGKSEYFQGRGIKGRIVASFMRAVGTIPIDRSGGQSSEAALRTALSVLQDNGVFGIYPEGTRSPDGRLYRGRTGVARLALESGAPVIPVAMVDTDKAQPLGRAFPLPRRCGVVFGEPLDFSRYQGMENDRFVLRAMTDEIVHSLLRISDQEYVDIYASTAKARMAAERQAASTGQEQ